MTRFTNSIPFSRYRFSSAAQVDIWSESLE